MLKNNIIGTANIINGSIIQGWFFLKKDIDKHLNIDLYVNNEKITTLCAKEFRKDIVKQNIHPTGKIGFKYQININSEDDVYLKFKNTDNIFVIQESFKGSENIPKKELCIVHIGMHKTGSSSIQYNLSRKKYKSFSYFNLGVENHSIPIYSLFSEKPEKYHIHIRAGRSTENVLKYNEKVKKMFIKHLRETSEYETYVISGEDISALSVTALEKFKEFLLTFFKKIKIIAYVRTPDSYMSSSFQERVKAGACTFNIEKDYPQYRPRFEKFDTIFGKENVELFKFEPQVLKDNDVTSDFLYRLDLNREKESYTRVNESLSLESVALLYVFNKNTINKLTIQEREKKRVELLQYLNTLGKKNFVLESSIVKNIIRKHKADIQWIENRMDIQMINSILKNPVEEVVKSEDDLEKIAIKFLEEMDEKQSRELYNIFDYKTPF